MIEITIGLLVFLCALFFGLSIEHLLAKHNQRSPILASDSSYLDIDLSGFEPGKRDETSSNKHSGGRDLRPLSSSALQRVDSELKREIRELDVSEVDFDL